MSIWDQTSVTLPGVLQTNVGHTNFIYVQFSKNYFRSQILFASLLVEHVGSVTVDF